MSTLPTWKFSLILPFVESSTISCNETPLRGELRQFFVKTLQPIEVNKPQKRRHVEGHYGEVLTSEKFCERLAKE